MVDFLNYVTTFSYTKEQIDAEVLRKNFVENFNREKLSKLTINEYAIGHGTKQDFCYLMENHLEPLGNIHGATSLKFGVYYSSKDNDYIWAKWTKQNFSTVRNAILDLYDAGLQKNIEKIKNNPLSPMFKGKILSIYFPERFLNVFADYHLKYFLYRLNLSYKNNMDSVDLREILINYKTSNKELVKLSAIGFGYCLYQYFGRPTEEETKIEQQLAEKYNDIRQNVEINNNINTSKKYKKHIDLPIHKPEEIETTLGHSYKRNIDKSIQAIIDANYSCEIDICHKSFLRKDGKHKYTEAHHLIPMCYQGDFEYSLDTPANIISLCSNCHNCLHYGADNEILLKLIYESRISRLKKCGLYITFSKLMSYYK